MLNVVTGPTGYPAAVLIRGVDKIMVPGAPRRSGSTRQTGIWFEQSDKTELPQVIRSARVGVDYAGPVWSKKEFRFSVAKG
jgi:DNA-3-methyladenine glycosylase